MTMLTSYFISRKNAGKIQKLGKKALFYDGQKRLYRTIWQDNEDGKLFVILDREAIPFRISGYNKENADPIFGYIQ